MKRMGHRESIEEIKNACESLIGKPGGKKLF
jgi:hypothetical protein